MYQLLPTDPLSAVVLNTCVATSASFVLPSRVVTVVAVEAVTMPMCSAMPPWVEE